MFWFKKLEILQFYPFSASSTATATETVAPTMGLLPNSIVHIRICVYMCKCAVFFQK